MNARAWSKLVLGVVAVLLTVSALALLYLERDGRATAEGGAIVADVLPVGTDYGGRIIDQRVDVGDAVSTGDVLFVVESLGLERELEAEQAAAEAEARQTGKPEKTVDVTDLWEITATADGTVGEIAVPLGGYVGTGAVVAKIYENGTLAASTAFRLDARDIARVTEGATATMRLPDGEEIDGTVHTMRVTTDDMGVLVVLEVDSEALSAETPTGLLLPGTPVDATVELTPSSTLAGVKDAARGLLDRVGL